MTEIRRFRHAPTFDWSRGRVKVYCLCGDQSPRLDSVAEAKSRFNAHIGLKEATPRRVT